MITGCYNTIKCTGLLSNFLYMLLAIGVMSAAGLGLQIAEPNTPEHTYFIETLVLGATICMIVIFGCYGLVCNLLSVNIIFTCFILIVLAVEYLQVHNYQPHRRYSGAWQQLELSQAWQRLETQPQLMQHYEQQQHCCGYNSVEDYKNLHMEIPESCYQYEVDRGNVTLSSRGCKTTLINNRSGGGIQHRDKLFMWCIVGLEIFILLQTIALSGLLYKLRRRRRLDQQQQQVAVADERRGLPANHVGSRAHLLDNV